MKKTIPIILTLVLLVSCGKEFLNKQPHEFTDAVFWKTAAQAESALAGVYTHLQGEEALGGEEWCIIESFSDNAYMNDNYSDYIAMSEFRALENNEDDLSHNSYVEYYQTIKRATDVLTNVPKITMDAVQQNRILGEANFLMFGTDYMRNRWGKDGDWSALRCSSTIRTRTETSGKRPPLQNVALM